MLDFDGNDVWILTTKVDSESVRIYRYVKHYSANRAYVTDEGMQARSVTVNQNLVAHQSYSMYTANERI